MASEDDPVGDDAFVLIDDHAALELKPTASARGDLWVHNKPRAQPLLASFVRRWEAAGHNLRRRATGPRLSQFLALVIYAAVHL